MDGKVKLDRDDPVWAEVYEAAGLAARNIHRRYSRWAEFEDLRAASLEYAWKRSDKVAEFLKREDEAELRQGKAALATFLRRAADRYARKEKAKKSGYEATDEYFYRVSIIEALIRVLRTGDLDLAGQTFDAEAVGERRSKRLANEGGNLMAMVADVERAMTKALDDRTREIMFNRYGDDLTLSKIAELHEISVSRADQIVHSGMRQMLEFLGGRSPY